jgi:hypothetical protein
LTQVIFRQDRQFLIYMVFRDGHLPQRFCSPIQGVKIAIIHKLRNPFFLDHVASVQKAKGGMVQVVAPAKDYSWWVNDAEK